jgi:hypothetical protein
VTCPDCRRELSGRELVCTSCLIARTMTQLLSRQYEYMAANPANPLHATKRDGRLHLLLIHGQAYTFCGMYPVTRVEPAPVPWADVVDAATVRRMRRPPAICHKCALTAITTHPEHSREVGA